MSGGNNNNQTPEAEKYQNLYYRKNKNVPSHVNVDIGNKRIGTVGGNLSSRMPVGYVDESGNIIKGYFTQNESVNALSLFQGRIEKISADPKNAQYLPILDMMIQSAKKSSLKKVSETWSNQIGLTSDYISKNRTEIRILQDKNGSNEASRSIFAEYLKKNGVPNELIDSEKNNTSFWNFISSVLSVSNEAVHLEGVHTNFQRQGKNTSINKRNNAMYEYAKLLGFEDLICKSSSMTVMRGNKKLEGSFMVNAKGTDHYKWDPRLKEMGNRKLEYSGNAIRDISNLQILDFLCGNIDRHPGNMFYELDYSDPNKITIKGIQGIDNDASFGAYEYKKRTKGYYTPLTDIKYIDSEMADKILAMNPEDIDKKIRLAGLDHKEIEAAHERLAALQKKIEDGKVSRIEGESSWSTFADEMSGKSTRKRIRVTDENLQYYNTFDNAAFAVENYNYQLEQYQNGKGDFTNKPKPKASGNLTIGISKTTFEHNTVDVHKNELLNIHQLITGPYEGLNGKVQVSPSADMTDFAAKLKETIDYMQQLSDRKAAEYKSLTEAGKTFYTFTLSDMERNKLTEKLDSLQREAQKYLTVHSDPQSPYDMAIKNHIENTKAYLDFAKESIQKDAIEAEKNMASKMSEAIERELDAMKARQTLPALLQTAIDVDSSLKKSSPEFKKMVSALKTLDESKLKTIVDKQVVYNKLIDLAQEYIDHKLPEGKQENELSNYEKARVDFAKDIIGFGTTRKHEAMKVEKERVHKDMAPKTEQKKSENILLK